MRTDKAKLNVTKNYDLFETVDQNRAVDTSTKKRRDLRLSMIEHGYIPAYPIYVTRNGSGHLIIRDGQHRLETAASLQLPVYYIVCKAKADIATINNTQVVWKLKDYARAFAESGNSNYKELIEFSKVYEIPISVCISILGNCSSKASGPNLAKFRTGGFKITSPEFAERIANLYRRLAALSNDVKNARLVQALFGFCLVDGVDDERLIKGAKRDSGKLKKFGTREGYLEMFETIYNLGRQKKVSIKFPAENILRQRKSESKRKAENKL